MNKFCQAKQMVCVALATEDSDLCIVHQQFPDWHPVEPEPEDDDEDLINHYERD